MKISSITTVGVGCCLLSLAIVSSAGERNRDTEKNGFRKYLKVIDLGVLDGDNLSKAYGINNASQIAGYSELFECSASTDEDVCPPANVQVIREQALRWEIKGNRRKNKNLRIKVENLGDVPGSTGDISYSNGLNELGQVTGRVVTTPEPFGPSFGFLWSKKRGMQYLGPDAGPFPVQDDPRLLPGGVFAQPISVNDKREVVGFANAGLTFIEVFDDPEVGCPQHLVKYGCQLGFIGTVKNGIRSTGTLEYEDALGEKKQYDFTRAKGITEEGLVTGFAGNFENPEDPLNPGRIIASEGFMWDENGGKGGGKHCGKHCGKHGGERRMRGIGFLPDGGTFSRGFIMNDLGQVSGHADETDPRDPKKQREVAFLYDSSTGKMQSLGTLPNPDYNSDNPESNYWTFSRGLGINIHGDVVGQSCLIELTDRDCAPTEADSLPFLWTVRWIKEGKMYDINDLVAKNPSGMKLLSAWGINDWGEIVGQGLVDGERHAFVAVRVFRRSWD